MPCFFLYIGEKGSWVRYWTLFGASNQLLAALTLLIITAWLKERSLSYKFVLYPMLFVFLITLSALVMIAVDGFQKTKGFDDYIVNSVSSIALLGVALSMIVVGIRHKSSAPKAA